MAKQVPTKNVTVLGVMRTAAFSLGFREVQAGKPIRYDAFEHDANAQWNYERGRIFGLIFNGPLKVGKAINRGAALHFAIALDQKVIL